MNVGKNDDINDILNQIKSIQREDYTVHKKEEKYSTLIKLYKTFLTYFYPIIAFLFKSLVLYFSWNYIIGNILVQSEWLLDIWGSLLIVLTLNVLIIKPIKNNLKISK